MINTIIFDMDGVICDTQKIHSKLDSKILGELGVKISPRKITNIFAGVKPEVYYAYLLNNKISKNELDKIIKLRWSRINSIAKREAKLMPGIKKLLRDLKNAGFKTAIASSSIKDFVCIILNKFDIKKYFNIVITGSEIKSSKPDPEIFIKAAKALKSRHSDCLVIEDGINGMYGAKKAKMHCIGLSNLSKDKIPTNYRVRKISQITIRYIESIK